MIEVLVTIVILVIGVLGLAGLQGRLQSAEMESYQRAQALILVKDMANRIAANRDNAGNYITAAIGAGTTDCTSLSATDGRAQADLAEWCSALQGAAETSGGGSVGAMVGGRGCVELNGADYLVTVAWQGLSPVALPTGSPTCGSGSYDGASGSFCTGDLCRRIVTTLVRIPTL